MIASVSANFSLPYFKSTFSALIYLTLALLTHACATITMPEGGPKDTTLPRLTQTYPTQECTNFQGKIITLTFDKIIKVSDIKNKLVVTPRLQKLKGQASYTYSVYGHSLRLKLGVPLAKDTTYTFNFNDAIKDITEGNAAKTPTLTFSTGDQIDTMYITGQVRHHMTHEPAAEVWVGLYKAEEESPNYLESLPDYFTKTDEKGAYRLDHISKGKYYLYASTNHNGELKIDPAVDAYGFLKEPIDVTTTPVEDINLSILKADVRPLKLQITQLAGRYFELGFDKPVTEYAITLPQQSQKATKAAAIYSHLVEDQQVIRVYNTFGLLEEDSLKACLTAQDALGQVIKTPITLRFGEDRHKQDFSYHLEPATGTAIKPQFVGTITCSKPLKTIVADRFFFVFNGQDTVRLSADEMQLNAQRDVVTIKKQLPPKLLKPQKDNAKEQKEVAGIVLHIEEGALVSIEKDKNEALSAKYNFRERQAYGSLKGTVTTSAPGFIVQLLDTSYQLVDEIRNEPHYQFKEVVPGNYKLRVLVLKNPDEAWEFGNILEQREPDPVLFYPEDIAVIANWEINGIDFSF